MFRARPAGPAPEVDQDDLPQSEPRGKAVGRRLRTAALDGSSVLARAVRLVAGGVVLIVGMGILFALLRANATNSVVSEIHGWGRWLVGPFNGMFSFRTARSAIAVNWGIAAVLYLLAGGLIARQIRRARRPSTNKQEVT
jgi:uncharacterized membrane protein HdeD (DUF308 family)